MPPDGQKLLPFYLVIDVSISMDGDRLAAANDIIPAIIDTLATDPILSDKVRFALVDFSDDATVQLPLCDLLDEDLVVPGLKVRGTTSYAAAFELLRREIPANVAQLKADGFVVHRPAVFFLSDGAPNPHEDWQQPFRELTHYDRSTGSGFASYPNVIPCGFGDADPEVMRSLIHPATGSRAMKMYLMDKGENPAIAIAKIAEILVASVIQSAAGGNGSGMTLPADSDLPAGVSPYTADDDFV